jgi:hypothetical protein
MQSIPIIILCIALSACTAKIAKTYTPPAISISFPDNMSDQAKLDLTNAIINNQRCNTPDTSISITITEYYEAPPEDKFYEWPFPKKKGDTIKGHATIQYLNYAPIKINIISNTEIRGIIGELEFNMPYIQNKFAKTLNKKICGTLKFLIQ